MIGRVAGRPEAKGCLALRQRISVEQQLFGGVIGKHGDENRGEARPARRCQPGFTEGQINPGGDQEVQKKRSESRGENAR